MKKYVCLAGLVAVMFVASIVGAIADDKASGKSGWKNLFEGKESDLKENWVQGITPRPPGPSGVWLVKDGELTMEANASYLWTKDKYGDFVLELEVKVPPEGNSGVFFRSTTDDPVQGGFEIQLLDDKGFVESQGLKIEDLGKHAIGALYDAAAPTKAAAKASGEWQSMRITAKGSKVTVDLNGEQILNVDLNDWTEARMNPDGTKNKFDTAYKDMPRTGRIGLQDHGLPFMFRNIRVKRLD